MSAPLTEKNPLLSTAGRKRWASIPAPLPSAIRGGAEGWAAASPRPAAKVAVKAVSRAAARRRRAKALSDKGILVGSVSRGAGSGATLARTRASSQHLLFARGSPLLPFGRER